ncbi:MAG: hypothetical protein LQ346_003137, partial [Caloplaca aetnensis]
MVVRGSLSLTILLYSKLAAENNENIDDAVPNTCSSESEGSAVSGIEEESRDLMTDIEESIDKYGNLIRTKKIVSSAVARERTNTAIATITKPERVGRAEIFWKAKFK